MAGFAGAAFFGAALGLLTTFVDFAFTTGLAFGVTFLATVLAGDLALGFAAALFAGFGAAFLVMLFAPVFATGFTAAFALALPEFVVFALVVFAIVGTLL